MTDTTIPPLWPCPFCGSEAIKEGLGAKMCLGCGAAGPYVVNCQPETRHHRIAEAWNRRALTPAQRRETSGSMEVSAVPGRSEPVSTKYFTISGWAKEFPWPTMKALDKLIRNGAKNGFDAVVRRVGGRVLLDEQAFHRWIAERDAEARAAKSEAAA